MRLHRFWPAAGDSVRLLHYLHLGSWRAATLYTLSPIGTRFGLGGCLDEFRARLR